MNKFTKILIASLLGFATIGGKAIAETPYPEKPITFVVPFAAGSATDKLARVLALEASKTWGQSIVVENKGGASGFIASQAVARAAPDGYTIFVTSNTTHASNSALFKNLPYDPVKDFAPVSKLGTIPMALVVNPKSIPVETVPEFIQYLKDNPEKVFFGSGSTSARISGELLKIIGDVKISNADYKSNPQAVMDLVGGQIQMMIADAATTLPLAKEGKLKALAVSTKTRSEVAPELPTLHESGLEGYEMVAWFASYVPAGTPTEIVDKINKEFVRILDNPEVKKNFLTMGIVAESSSPEALSAFQAEETAKWKDIVAKAGIEIQ